MFNRRTSRSIIEFQFERFPTLDNKRDNLIGMIANYEKEESKLQEVFLETKFCLINFNNFNFFYLTA